MRWIKCDSQAFSLLNTDTALWLIGQTSPWGRDMYMEIGIRRPIRQQVKTQLILTSSNLTQETTND